MGQFFKCSLVIFIYFFGTFSYAQSLPKGYVGTSMGISFQSSDVKDKIGVGIGLNTSYFLHHQEKSFIAIAARLSYLYAQMTGRDNTSTTGILNNKALNGTNSDLNFVESPGFVYHNYQTKLHYMAIGMEIRLNKLQISTGVVAYGFGGIGITHFNTKMDHKNANGIAYNYENITNSTEWALTSDQEYETEAESNGSNIVLSPSLGIGLGYAFNKNIQLVLEHQVTYTNTDLLDGNQWTENNQLTAENDLFHSISLNLKIGFGNGHHIHEDPVISYSRHSNSSNQTNFEKNEVSKRPFIQLITPSYYVSKDCSIEAKARVYDIENANQLTISLNESVLPNSKYQYDLSSKLLTVTADVQDGDKLKIYAYNPSGNHSRTITISCINNRSNGTNTTKNAVNEENVIPEITFINPKSELVYSSSPNFNVRASIEQTSKNDISFYVNGEPTTFEYDSYTDVFNSNILLKKGMNDVVIVVTNEKIRKSKKIEIDYTPQQQNSTAAIVFESANTSKIDKYGKCSAIVKAKIEQAKPSQVFVTLNGKPFFDYQINGTYLTTTMSINNKTTLTIKVEKDNEEITASKKLFCK